MKGAVNKVCKFGPDKDSLKRSNGSFIINRYEWFSRVGNISNEINQFRLSLNNFISEF